MITEHYGDLLDSNSQLIAHGVNCQGVMGSGVAKAIYERYPEVRDEYMQLFQNTPTIYPEQRLGSVQYVFLDNKKVVANCFTQQNFGGGDQIYLSYAALEACLRELSDMMHKLHIHEIAIPKIGCGLAGGDWETVKKILETVFPDYITVKVYIK